MSSTGVVRFARAAQIHNTKVAWPGRLVTGTLRQYVPNGAVDEALAGLPYGPRELLEPADTHAEAGCGR